MRWVWLQKTEPHRPWANLPIHVLEQASAFFKVVVYSEVGDGTKTLFWTDRWLHGQCIADLAPRLFAIIPKGGSNNELSKMPSPTSLGFLT